MTDVLSGKPTDRRKLNIGIRMVEQIVYLNSNEEWLPASADVHSILGKFSRPQSQGIAIGVVHWGGPIVSLRHIWIEVPPTASVDWGWLRAPCLTATSEVAGTMFGMAARDQSKGAVHEENQHWRVWSDDLFKIATGPRYGPTLNDTSADPPLVRITLFVQRSTKSVFPLLWATINMFYDSGPHRSQRHGSLDDVEERKGVWWTYE